MSQAELVLLDELEREHVALFDQLETLHRLTASLDPSQEMVERPSPLAAWLAEFPTAIRRHASIEEARLYPLMEAGAPISFDPKLLATLRSEHLTIDALLQELEQHWASAASGDGDALPAFAKAAQSLRGTLSAHLQRENLLVFPRLRRAWNG